MKSSKFDKQNQSLDKLATVMQLDLSSYCFNHFMRMKHGNIFPTELKTTKKTKLKIQLNPKLRMPLLRQYSKSNLHCLSMVKGLMVTSFTLLGPQDFTNIVILA